MGCFISWVNFDNIWWRILLKKFDLQLPKSANAWHKEFKECLGLIKYFLPLATRRNLMLEKGKLYWHFYASIRILAMMESIYRKSVIFKVSPTHLHFLLLIIQSCFSSAERRWNNDRYRLRLPDDVSWFNHLIKIESDQEFQTRS